MKQDEVNRMVEGFEQTIRTQLRSLGVVLHDDVGERIRPDSREEARIVTNIARNCVNLVVNERECQTTVPSSYANMTPEEQWAYDKKHGRLDSDS